jgi:hypothetical protein
MGSRVAVVVARLCCLMKGQIKGNRNKKTKPVCRLKSRYRIKKISYAVDKGREYREMIIPSYKGFDLLLSIVCILVLVACGDGGSSGGDFVPAEPTGLTYTGVTSPAVIDSNNAAELAGDAFIGGETGSNLGIFSSVANAQPNIVRKIKLYEVIQTFDGAIQKIDIKNHPGDLLALKTDQETVPGNCGGVASYTLEMDDSNGSFTGSMTFNDYCNGNIVVSGTADFYGQFTVDRGDFLDFNLYLDMVNLTSGEQSYVIDGDVLVDVSRPASTASVDMLMKDSSGEVFWVKDYTLTIFESVDYADIEVSGRFYHPTYGHVDLSTILPVRIFNIDDWPSFGELQVAGGDATKARLLAFDNNSCRIIVDTCGDDTYNYESDFMSWSDL